MSRASGKGGIASVRVRRCAPSASQLPSAISLCLVAFVALLSQLGAPAAAQSVARSPRLVPELSLPLVNGLAASPYARDLHRRQRQARWLMTIGVGMTAASLVSIAMYQLHDQGCDAGGLEPLYTPGIAGGAFGLAGIALTIGGVIRVNGVPLEYRRARPLGPGRIVGMVSGAILSGLVTWGTVTVLSAPQLMRCWNS